METIEILYEHYQEGAAIIVAAYVFARIFFPKWIEIKFKNPLK